MSKPLPSTPSESPESPESPATSETLCQDADTSEYSTLEVHKGRFIEADSSSAPIVRPQPDSMKIATFDKDAEKEIIVTETSVADESDISVVPAPIEPKILGLKRKTFLIALVAAVFVIIAAAVGGGVGAAVTHRNKDVVTQASNTTATNTTSPATTTVAAHLYTNTGLAAMQWTDQTGVLHKRLYYQDSANKIKESGWDNNTDFNTTWTMQTISDEVKPATPIGAVAGYPHASYNYTLVNMNVIIK